MHRVVVTLVTVCLLLAGCSAAAPIHRFPAAVVAPPTGRSTIRASQPLITPATPGTSNATHGTMSVARPGLRPVATPAIKPASDTTVAPDNVTPAKATPAKVTPPAKTGPRLAILVYHDVDDRTSNAFTISTAQFDAQVKMLVEEGYAFYHLSDVERLLAGGKGMPERAVLLAFDDGYSSFYTHVMPIARKYGVPATCFVVTKYLDQVITGSLPHMSVAQTKELAASPLADLAGHSHNGHYEAPIADGSSKPVLTQPIRKANGEVETLLEYQERVRGDFKQTIATLSQNGASRNVRHFTFPYTARSEEAVRLGQQAGVEYFYVGGEKLVTPQSDRTAIPRVHAGAPDITAELLRTKLEHLFAQP